MSKKQDAFYFDNFIACASCACEAAHYLEEAFKNFDPEHLHEKLDGLHQVEHAADGKKHELSNVLARAFITPIETGTLRILQRAAGPSLFLAAVSQIDLDSFWKQV